MKEKKANRNRFYHELVICNMSDFTFTIQSEIKSDRATVWKHITQLKNVNAELLPYARMTYPADRAELGDMDVPMGTTLLVSVILLFCVIPVDLHFLRFDRIVAGEGFYENSVTLTHRFWKHNRTLADSDAGVILRDGVTFCPWMPLVGYVLLPVYKFIFRHRHERLKEYFMCILLILKYL